jgi:hypothetical protein
MLLITIETIEKDYSDFLWAFTDMLVLVNSNFVVPKTYLHCDSIIILYLILKK